MQAIRISNMEKLNSNLFSCCNFCCFFCSKQSFLFSRINHFNLRKWRYTRTISITVVVVGFLRFQLYIDRLVGRMINDHLCRLQSQANLSAWLSVCLSVHLDVYSTICRSIRFFDVDVASPKNYNVWFLTHVHAKKQLQRILYTERLEQTYFKKGTIRHFCLFLCKKFY